MIATFPDLNRFAAMVDEMASLTGRERSVVVRNVARDFCYAALRNTPMADPVQRRASTSAWVALYHRYTGEVVVFPGTPDQVVKYGRRNAGGRIPNRGFAKAGWLGCLRKLGVQAAPKGDMNPAKRTAETLMNEVRVVQGSEMEGYEVANQTPPIVPLDSGGPHNQPHNIGAKSLDEALVRMEAALVKLRARQERRWSA